MATASPYQQLEQEFRRLHAFRGVLAVLKWDAAITMPRASSDVRGEQLAALEIESHNLLIAPRISRLLDRADANGRSLAGWQAAKQAGLSVGAEPAAAGEICAGNQTHPWPIFPHPKGGEFVDFDEDLKYADLINGIADGFDNVELLKRYSTVGMGPSQGKHSAVAAVRIVARETGRDLATMTVTTQRPPYTPEKFGHLAGRVFEPERHHLVVHERNER